MISGIGYSGSTLLSFLLNAHPSITSVGEITGLIPSIRDVEGYRCSCGRTLTECPFWQSIGARMSSRGHEFGPDNWRTRFDLSEHAWVQRVLVRSLRSRRVDRLRDKAALRLPVIGRRIRTIAGRNEALFEAILAETCKPVLADASKDPRRIPLLRATTNLDLRPVHLVRDAPGYVASAIRHKGVSAEVAATRWAAMAAQIERTFDPLPAHSWMRLRYEDLCADPAAALTRIAEHAGVAGVQGPVGMRESDHHVIGNQMRLGSSTEIRLDERWKTVLSHDQLGVVRRITERWRAEYGYA
jgi:hypothetical protein